MSKRGAPDEDADAPKLTLTFASLGGGGGGGGGGGAKKQRKKSSKKSSKRSRRDLDPEEEQTEGLALDADAAALSGDTADEILLETPTPGGLDVTAGFTPMQLRRYEKFRRSAFSRTKLKRLVQEASGQTSCSDKVAIVVQAVAKTLVGELVERGRDVMLEWGDEGPLRPRHVQEAHRRLQAQGSVLCERPARAFVR